MNQCHPGGLRGRVGKLSDEPNPLELPDDTDENRSLAYRIYRVKIKCIIIFQHRHRCTMSASSAIFLKISHSEFLYRSKKILTVGRR